jgi:hypothetical protein
MIFAFEWPDSRVIFSEVLYPVVVGFFRYEIISFRIAGMFILPINVINVFICLWIVVCIWRIRVIIEKLKGERGGFSVYNILPHDEYAESLLANTVGFETGMNIFRINGIASPMVSGSKPYIFLPRFDFSSDELRVILKHEWKHYYDRDSLTKLVMLIICAVFWWNPLVYVLKKNLSFALELKCDYYAVPDREEYEHYKSSMQRLRLERELLRGVNGELSSRLISDKYESMDRMEVLSIHSDSPVGRILSNVCFAIMLSALFLMSYMVLIKPVWWESPDVLTSAECFTGEEPFRAGETFIVDNGDGTFSLYIDGQFIQYVDTSDELFIFLPMRIRGECYP